MPSPAEFGEWPYNHISRAEWLALLLLSYCGIVLVFGQDLGSGGSNIVLGALMVLGAAMSYGVFSRLAFRVKLCHYYFDIFICNW